jgi:hypothetical protein
VIRFDGLSSLHFNPRILCPFHQGQPSFELRLHRAQIAFPTQLNRLVEFFLLRDGLDDLLNEPFAQHGYQLAM